MRIFLSNSDYLHNFESFLRSFDPSEPSKLIVESHQTWISIHPVVLTMVAALGRTVRPENVQINAITATSGHYLSRMRLYEALGMQTPGGITEHEPAGKFIPITQIKTQEDQSRFITEVVPLLHLGQRQSDAIRYVVGELVRNVLEHSGSPEGAFVAAQYYPRANKIRLGICDAGVGVWKTIHQSWAAKTDLEAIQLALTPGITGTTKREGGTEANAGAGLFFIKSMAVVARDYFVLYSGTGMYKLRKRDKRLKGVPRLKIDPFADTHSGTNEAPDFPGTVVGIDISLDQSTEFKELLSVIRSAYTSAVKERRKRRHMIRPNFR